MGGLCLCLSLAAMTVGCAGVKPMGDGTGGRGVNGGQGGNAVVVMRCNGPNGLCTDFPTSPIVDNGAPTNTCSAPSGAGPCIMEPEDGTLFPNNWLRPRVSVQGIAGPMKITVHSDQEVNDLVVYASSTTWTMRGYEEVTTASCHSPGPCGTGLSG